MGTISDEERREVARRLRGLNGNAMHVRRVYEAEGISISCDDQADYYQTCDAITGYLPAEHMHLVDYEELHNRLADLIEPEPERTCRDTDYYTESITCSECGEITRETLFWVDVDGGKTVKGHRPRFCSNCGARVVDA